MRIQQFFEAMCDYDFSRAAGLAVSGKIMGGWESWLQVELAMYLVGKLADARIIREMTYPDEAARCDFYIEYGGGRDPTYVELKCQLPGRGDTINDALLRFQRDIAKQKNYPEIAGFCFMASCGPWADGNITALDAILKATGTVSVYALGCSSTVKPVVKKLEKTEDLACFKAPLFFLLGVSA
jgi:hypothetical protein